MRPHDWIYNNPEFIEEMVNRLHGDYGYEILTNHNIHDQTLRNIIRSNIRVTDKYQDRRHVESVVKDVIDRLIQERRRQGWR